MKTSDELDIVEILKRLPHRHPMLLVDKVLRLVQGESIVAIKLVSYNEPQVVGYRPHDPVMPPMLVLEAACQAGAILILSAPENQGKNAFFAGCDQVKWRQDVRPGDVLRITVKRERQRGTIFKGSVVIRVGRKTVFKALLTAALQDME